MFLPLVYRGDRLKALVIGGGKVAERKVRDLLEAGAKVTVVAPEICGGITSLSPTPRLSLVRKEYDADDLREVNLVVVATDDPLLNRQVSDRARAAGIPVNVVDQPELCTVYFTAVVKRDPIVLAVSTGGTAPFLAKELKRLAGEWLEENDWPLRAKWAEIIRAFVLDNIPDRELRETLFARFLEQPRETLAEWDPAAPPLELWRSWITDR